MLKPFEATTSHVSFSDVIERLKQRDIVDGLLVIGSASEEKLTAASDFDLVIVLAESPLPLHVGVTTIDHRLTDLIFLTSAQIENVLALDASIDRNEWLGRIVRWLQAGTIVWDREGRLSKAQRKVEDGQWLAALDPMDGYGSWFRVNYNLAQTRRMRLSKDPVYQAAVDLRVALYGPSDLLFGYFEIRNLTWEGEKAAVRYLMAHDPSYLDQFQQFIREDNRDHKFERYEALAELTVAPLGSRWSDHPGAIGFSQTIGLETVDKAVAFWQQLVEPVTQTSTTDREADTDV